MSGLRLVVIFLAVAFFGIAIAVARYWNRVVTYVARDRERYPSLEAKKDRLLSENVRRSGDGGTDRLRDMDGCDVLAVCVWCCVRYFFSVGRLGARRPLLRSRVLSLVDRSLER